MLDRLVILLVLWVSILTLMYGTFELLLALSPEKIKVFIENTDTDSNN